MGSTLYNQFPPKVHYTECQHHTSTKLIKPPNTPTTYNFLFYSMLSLTGSKLFHTQKLTAKQIHEGKPKKDSRDFIQNKMIVTAQGHTEARIVLTSCSRKNSTKHYLYYCTTHLSFLTVPYWGSISTRNKNKD